MKAKGIKGTHVRAAGRKSWTVVRNGFLVGMLLILILAVTPPVVVGMHPVAWRFGDGYVEAYMRGFKWRSCQPVAWSEHGTARAQGYTKDVPFDFMGDASPGSANPSRVWSDYGWWRWYDPTADAVSLTMTHLCEGNRRVYSSFGFYEVPDRGTGTPE